MKATSTLTAMRQAVLAATLAVSLTTLAQVPRIDSVAPGLGHIGDSITISGANFSPAPAANIVYFGAVQAVVTAATANSLTVVVPSGATYAPVTVTVGGLTGFGNIPFCLQFKGHSRIGLSCFAPRVDIPAGPSGSEPPFCLADLDGDGKPDVVFADAGGLAVLRNISVAGNISAASFAPEVEFAPVTNLDLVSIQIAIGDLDGDGKLDVVLADKNGIIIVYRNHSTAGTIAFDPPVLFQLGARITLSPDLSPNANQSLAISDVDGDGKPDILVHAAGFGVLRNTCNPGVIDASSFAPAVFFPNDGDSSLVIADLDGDGRPDVVAGGAGNFTCFVSRNVSSPGNIAFDPQVFVDLGAGSGNGVGSGQQSLLIADLNGDGKPDIVSGWGTVGVAQNHSVPGRFTSDEFTMHYFYIFQASVGLLAIADLDGDGRPDILGTQTQTALHNLTPPGAEFSPDTFSEPLFPNVLILPQGNMAYSIAVCDIDGDGQPDLLMHDDLVGSPSLSVYPGACIDVTQITPASARAGGPGFNLEVDGSCLRAGSVVLWNGTTRPTTFVNDAQLIAAIPASDLASSSELTAAAVAVQNPDGSISEPLVFTVTSSSIGGAQSAMIPPEQSATIASPNLGTPLTQPGDAALSAVIPNSNVLPATVLAATYMGNPTASPVFDVGGGFVDLKIIEIPYPPNFISGLLDSALVNFYYPTTVSGAAESALTLQYFNPATASWQTVASSVHNAGDPTPAKDTTDNLDGTVSGGRFTVLFDITSTPKITDLVGTVFAMAPLAPVGPVIKCPADIVASTASGQCSAMVNYTVTTTGGSGAVNVTSVPPSGSVFPKGTTIVNCTATDGSGNQSSCSFQVTVKDTEKPSITCPPNITVLADCSGSAVVTFPTPAATDNCGGPTVVCTPTSGTRFSLGTTKVTCTATDAAGNSSSCSFAVTVNALPVNCQPISALLQKSRIHFHHGGEAYADFNGDLTLLDGKIPTDFRGSSLTAQGRLTILFGNSSTPAYCNNNITFAVKDVDADDDKEKWEFSGTGHEKISFQWKDRLMYDASLDPALPARAGKLASQFIHTSESELRFDFSKATLPVTITVNDIVLVTVASKTSVSSPFSFDAHGQKVDVLWPARLVPGDVVKWYADANPGDGLSGLVYTQTIASGTARETYYNAGGNFDIRVPLSGVNLTDVPRTATVQLAIGPGSSAPGGPFNGCASFALQTCDQDGDEHWQFNDPDDDDN